MDNNTKFELAKEILSRMMAIATQNGFDANDPIQKQLLEEEKQLNSFNEKVVDKIINEYSKIVKIGAK